MFDDDYYYQNRIVYPNRVLYVAQPGAVIAPQGSVPPGVVQINPYQRVIYAIPNMQGMGQPVPFNMQMQMPKQKKTIDNLRQYFEEVELTQSILDKGEQKKCSICLENFEVGTKIIYLPCFHYYHTECIDTWVKNSDKCPLCNIEIKLPQ